MWYGVVNGSFGLLWLGIPVFLAVYFHWSLWLTIPVALVWLFLSGRLIDRHMPRLTNPVIEWTYEKVSTRRTVSSNLPTTPLVIPESLIPQIDAELSKHNLLQAIVLLRKETGCGLLEAKNALTARQQQQFPDLHKSHRNLSDDD